MQDLGEIARPARALVVGASGGIGAALAERLDASGFDVCRASRRSTHDVALDITDEESVAAVCAGLRGGPPLRVVAIASGLLHGDDVKPEKALRDIDAAMMARVFAVNTIGPALLAKHALPLMPREGRSVLAALSARVGSIADNRLGGWYSYRASKAALNQVVRTLGIEAARTHPDLIAVALHPGTVRTDLSAPFRGNRETVTPEEAAANLLRVIGALTPAESGGFFAWDGAAIPT